MNDETYFDRMKDTSMKVDRVIFDYLSPLMLQNPKMYEAVVNLPEKRKGLPKVRAHLARESYEISSGRDHEGWQNLCAAIELELNAMYYRNQIFDKKAGCSNEDNNDVIRNWSADSFSRDLAEQILQKSYPQNNRLVDLLRKSNMVFSIGEFRDTTQNTYPQVKNLTFDEQMDLCSKRIYEINASFFEKLAAMGAIAAGEMDDSRISALSNFGKSYGMALQIVNDIADFVPPRINSGTTEKTGNDAYNDIKNRKMTYPVIWLLHNGSGENKCLLEKVLSEGFNADPNQLEELTRVLVRGGAINFAKQKAKTYGIEAKRNLHNHFSKEKRRFISSMCAMFYKNRHYDALKEFEKDGKQ
jgi:geranylgeranyl pyrophosphate synthase